MPEITLSNATDEQLIEEMMRRRETLVASIWTSEDTRPIIEEDDECAHLTDDQKNDVAQEFLAYARRELQDALGNRGNDFLSDRWAIDSEEIIAKVVRTAPVV